MDEAVEWGKRCPNPMPGPSEIEIRPLFEVADFAEAMTQEQVDQEDRMREELGGALPTELRPQVVEEDICNPAGTEQSSSRLGLDRYLGRGHRLYTVLGA